MLSVDMPSLIERVSQEANETTMIRCEKVLVRDYKGLTKVLLGVSQRYWKSHLRTLIGAHRSTSMARRGASICVCKRLDKVVMWQQDGKQGLRQRDMTKSPPLFDDDGQ